jgi:uncharacterized membrane protein YeaQ/YmgE (transglycosylase-associated protein family)
VIVLVIGYVVGWLATAIIATRFWYSHFAEAGFEGAAWGSLVGLFWPLALPVFVVMMAARGLGASH